MKKSVYILFLLLPFFGNTQFVINPFGTYGNGGGGTNVCTGTLLYATGYDQQSDIVNANNQLGKGSVSFTTYVTAPGSFKSYVDNTAASHISSGWRSEVQYGENLSMDGAQITVQYDVRFETMTGGGVGGLCGQWHGNANGTSGQLSLWLSGGQFMVVRSVQAGINIYQGGSLMNIQLNHWYHMVWQIKFTSGSTGYVMLYIDGTLYYNASGVQTSDGTGQYLKIGQNLFNGPSAPSILYYDNLSVCTN